MKIILILYKSLFSDSIFMALTKPIDEIILPQYRDYWFKTLRHQWFVIDEKDINQARLPGSLIIQIYLFIFIAIFH